MTPLSPGDKSLANVDLTLRVRKNLTRSVRFTVIYQLGLIEDRAGVVLTGAEKASSFAIHKVNC
jgi:hypothetical protein